MRHAHLFGIVRIKSYGFDPADIDAAVFDRRVVAQARHRFVHVGVVAVVHAAIIGSAEPKHSGNQTSAEQRDEKTDKRVVYFRFHACSLAARPRGP